MIEAGKKGKEEPLLLAFSLPASGAGTMRATDTCVSPPCPSPSLPLAGEFLFTPPKLLSTPPLIFYKFFFLNYPPSFSLHTPALVFPLLLSPAPLPSPSLPSTALPRPISSPLLGTGSAPPLLVRGSLFGPVWPNKSHSVRLDRPGRTEALHSIKQNRTEGLRSVKQDRTKALRSALFGRMMPESAEGRREPVPRSGEETRAKGGYWERAEARE